jgi:hypothetical protein
MRRVGWDVAICRHKVDPGDRFKRAQQNGAGEARGFATDVHAEVKAVNLVDVRMSSGAKEDLGAGRGPSMRMGSAIRLRVVGPEVGFELDDASDDDARRRAMDEQFSEEPGTDELGGTLKKAAGHQAAGQANRRFAGYLCALFHSLM